MRMGQLMEALMGGAMPAYADVAAFLQDDCGMAFYEGDNDFLMALGDPSELSEEDQ